MADDFLLLRIKELEDFIIPRIKSVLLNGTIGYVLGKQLLRSATSIGANVREAKGAQSRRDFLAKLYISRKECYESLGWIRNIATSKLLIVDETKYMENLLTQILRIISRSTMTAQMNAKKQ